MRDRHDALRRLAGTPAFAAVAVLTLAPGIGANATIQVMNAFLRYLPAQDIASNPSGSPQTRVRMAWILRGSWRRPSTE